MYENQERYMAIAVANKLHVADTGTPSVQIKFQTLYNMKDQSQPITKTLWGSLYLSDSCFERSMETLSEVFGFKSDDIQEINNNTTLFAGIEAVIVTDQEEYNGECREKIKFINHPAGGAGKKLEDSEAARLSAELRNKIKAFHMKSQGKGSQPSKREIPPARRQAQAPVQQQAQPQFQEDDLPF